MPRRRTDLLSRSIGSETLVVDESTGLAHSLDAVSARVLRLCDGETTSAAAALQLGLPAVQLTSVVGELEAAGLLAPRAGVSRRDLFGRSAVVVGGLAASGVATLALPQAASAASATTTIGNEPLSRQGVDQAHDFYQVDMDASVPTGYTTLTSFSAYTTRADSIAFLVYRSTLGFLYASPTIPTVAGGITTSGPVSIPVNPGDRIGVYTSGSGNVPFTDGSGGPVSQSASGQPFAPAAGSGANFQTVGLTRTYSLQAVVFHA